VAQNAFNVEQEVRERSQTRALDRKDGYIVPCAFVDGHGCSKGHANRLLRIGPVDLEALGVGHRVRWKGRKRRGYGLAIRPTSGGTVGVAPYSLSSIWVSAIVMVP